MALDGDLERVDETIDRVERITRTRRLREQPWTVGAPSCAIAAGAIRPAVEHRCRTICVGAALVYLLRRLGRWLLRPRERSYVTAPAHQSASDCQ